MLALERVATGQLQRKESSKLAAGLPSYKFIKTKFKIRFDRIMHDCIE